MTKDFGATEIIVITCNEWPWVLILTNPRIALPPILYQFPGFTGNQNLDFQHVNFNQLNCLELEKDSLQAFCPTNRVFFGISGTGI